MMDTDLWMFVAALAVAYLMPGPDMVLVLQTGALGGRDRAVATAAGLALARAAHVTVAVLGLAALLRAVPWAFDAVRLAGAAYLVWLGLGLLRADALAPDRLAAGGDRAGSRAAALRRGFVTNIANPKALLFCSVLLPQFIRPELGHGAGRAVLLGAILVGTGLAFDLVLASAGAGLGRALVRHPRWQALQRRLFAALLIGFGLRLAAD